MATLSVRRSFAFFHLVLGTVIFVESVRTAVSAMQGHAANPPGVHLAILAAIEAAAALMFMLPWTLRVGSILLICIFVFAMGVHGLQHELNLVVYAAGVLFVSLHGSAFSMDLLRNVKA